ASGIDDRGRETDCLDGRCQHIVLDPYRQEDATIANHARSYLEAGRHVLEGNRGLLGSLDAGEADDGELPATGDVRRLIVDRQQAGRVEDPSASLAFQRLELDIEREVRREPAEPDAERGRAGHQVAQRGGEVRGGGGRRGSLRSRDGSAGGRALHVNNGPIGGRPWSPRAA